jgi:hypothetical protein
MHFFCSVYRGLKSCTSLLENFSLRVPANNLRDFQLFGVCPSNKHCPLLGAPVLPTRWVKISTYLQSGTFLSITFMLINLKLLIMFVRTPNVLCYVALSYHVLVNTRHLRLTVCLLFCINIFLPSVLACNLSSTLCCVCPHYNYLYLHCAVSAIGLDSAHI